MTFEIKRIALSALLLCACTTPGFAQAVQSNLTLNLGGDVEQRTLQYDCGEPFGRISVSYIDAAPNFLALVPYEGSTLIFAAVTTGSDTRYAAGNYEWATKGTDATFTDLTVPKDTPPMATCSELSLTP